MTIADLETRLTELGTELQQLKQEGDILTGAWIDSNSREARVYHRLRWYRGPGENGRELSPGCRTLKPGELGKIRAQIARGKRLEVLEAEIAEVQGELAEKQAIARELGLL
jgi:hypothetical protein